MSCAGQRWERAARTEAPHIAPRSGAWRKGEEQWGERDGPENDTHFISQVVPNVWKGDKVQVTHCDRTRLSCDAMQPVQRPSQSSAAHLKGPGDLLGTGARLFPGRAGGSGRSARLLLRPGTCRASHRPPWAGARRGSAASAAGGCGTPPGAPSGCPGWHSPSAPRLGGLVPLPSPGICGILG